MGSSAGLVQKALPQKKGRKKANVLENTKYSKVWIAFQTQVTFHSQPLLLLTVPIQTRFLSCSQAAFVLIAKVSRALRCAMQTVKNHINPALISEGRSQQKSGHHTDRCCCEKELPSFSPPRPPQVFLQHISLLQVKHFGKLGNVTMNYE